MATTPEKSNAIRTAVVVAMILLALIGVGLTTADSWLAFRYWVILVPVIKSNSSPQMCPKPPTPEDP